MTPSERLLRRLRDELGLDLVEPTEFVGGPRCGQVMDVPKCFDDLRTPEAVPEARVGGKRGCGLMIYYGRYRRAARRSAAGNAIFEWQGAE